MKTTKSFLYIIAIISLIMALIIGCRPDLSMNSLIRQFSFYFSIFTFLSVLLNNLMELKRTKSYIQRKRKSKTRIQAYIYIFCTFITIILYFLEQTSFVREIYSFSVRGGFVLISIFTLSINMILNELNEDEEKIEKEKEDIKSERIRIQNENKKRIKEKKEKEQFLKELQERIEMKKNGGK